MTPAKKIFLIVLLFLLPGFLFSQEIITDRPDRTESPQTVGKNKFQIETGLEYSSFKFNTILTDETGMELGVSEFKIKTLTAPTTLLRYGILKNVELRLGIDFDRAALTSDMFEFDNNQKLSLNPPKLGAKVEIAKGEGIKPDFSVIGAFTLPNIGAEDKQTQYVVPELILAFSNDINDKFSVGYNFGIETTHKINITDFFYSVSLGMSINSRLGAFAEFFGDTPNDDYSISNRSVDGGLTYLIKNNIQVDAYGGLGLSEDANDFFLGTGIAFKF